MKQRVFSTFILWTLLVLIPLYFGPPGAAFLIGVFGLLSMIELRGLLRRCGFSLHPTTCYASGLALLGLAALGAPDPLYLAAAFSAVNVIGLSVILLQSPVDRFAGTAAGWLLFICLVPLPFALAAHLLAGHGVWILVWVIAVAKFTDVGALLTGLLIGKHRMAPSLSPKKTWEGFAGGLLTAILVSGLYIWLFESYLPAGFTLVQGMWMALPIALAGVSADLLESALKRSAKVKDSGSRIPGIGGILDLTDSVMLAFPTAYVLFFLVT